MNSYRKVLLSSFHLSDHILGFHQRTKKNTLYSIINSTTGKFRPIPDIVHTIIITTVKNKTYLVKVKKSTLLHNLVLRYVTQNDVISSN